MWACKYTDKLGIPPIRATRACVLFWELGWPERVHIERYLLKFSAYLELGTNLILPRIDLGPLHQSLDHLRHFCLTGSLWIMQRSTWLHQSVDIFLGSRYKCMLCFNGPLRLCHYRIICCSCPEYHTSGSFVCFFAYLPDLQLDEWIMAPNDSMSLSLLKPEFLTTDLTISPRNNLCSNHSVATETSFTNSMRYRHQVVLVYFARTDPCVWSSLTRHNGIGSTKKCAVASVWLNARSLANCTCNENQNHSRGR